MVLISMLRTLSTFSSRKFSWKWHSRVCVSALLFYIQQHISSFRIAHLPFHLVLCCTWSQTALTGLSYFTLLHTSWYLLTSVFTTRNGCYTLIILTPGIATYHFSISQNVTHIVASLTHIPDRASDGRYLTDLFLRSNPGDCVTDILPPIGNSDHSTVSVCVLAWCWLSGEGGLAWDLRILSLSPVCRWINTRWGWLSLSSFWGQRNEYQCTGIGAQHQRHSHAPTKW